MVEDLLIYHIELENQYQELEKQKQEFLHAKHKLKVERNRYLNLYDNAPVGYFVVDKKGIIIEVNLTGASLLGVERGFLKGKPFFSFISDETKAKFYLMKKNLLESKTPQSCELKLMKKEGSEFHAKLDCIAVENAEGNFIEILTALTDITKQKQAERLMSKISSAVEQAIDGIAISDLESRLQYVNTAYATMHGYSKRDLLGMNVQDLHKKDHQNNFQRGVSSIINKEMWIGEAGSALRYSTPFPTHMSVSLLKNDEGNPEGMLAIVRNITERKRAEKELKRSEAKLRRLSSHLLEDLEIERKRIGLELHNGIAQTVSAIKLWVENALLLLNREESSEAAKSLEKIVPVTQQIIEDIRRISRELRPKILNGLGILASISWLCKEFEKTYPEIIVEMQLDILEEDVHDDLKIIIFRILQEALVNIGKYSKAKLVRINLKEKHGMIELSVNDDGVGFDVEQMLHEKKAKKGHGLAIMRERTELLNGSFSIESSKGSGTSVRVKWPALG
ncbi:MAG: PAS domain S-box protein [Candidatus Hodarchaeota archaeon]